jgi:hypothetical protein
MDIAIYQSVRDSNLFCAELKTNVGISTGGNDTVHLAILLDVSGSMEGKGLNELKRTLKALVKCLTEKDSLTIIAYSSDSELICSAKTIGKDLETWYLLINGLIARGNTNIESAFSTLARTCVELPHGIILLTDGIVNMGATSAKAIVLPLETNFILQNIPIFTLGIGDKHNQIMLRDIASGSQGNYFYIDTSEDLPQTFGSILGVLRDRAVEDISMTLSSDFIWLERHISTDKREVLIPYLGSQVEQRLLFRREGQGQGQGQGQAPNLSSQFTIQPIGKQNICTPGFGIRSSLLVDAEMIRLTTKDILNQATNMLSICNRLKAIELLENLQEQIEEDSELRVLPQVMCMRGLVLDILETLKRHSEFEKPALMSRMTTFATTLDVQRSSAFKSPELNLLYGSRSMRVQTQHVTQHYDSM